MSILGGMRKGLGIGCGTCGGTRTVNVPVHDLNSSSVFSGTLLACQSCGRVFCPPSFIGEDQRTLLPLDSLTGTGSLRQAAANPRFAVVLPDALPPRTKQYRCILGRPFHSEDGLRFVRSILWHCVFAQNTEHLKDLPERLSLEIDGYSDDSREIWQVPELTSLFYRIHDEVPAIEFWLTAESMSVFLKTAAAGVPAQKQDEILTFARAMGRTMEDLSLGEVQQSASDEQEIILHLMAESLAKVEGFLGREFPGQDGLVARLVAQSALGRALGKTA